MGAICAGGTTLGDAEPAVGMRWNGWYCGVGLSGVGGGGVSCGETAFESRFPTNGISFSQSTVSRLSERVSQLHGHVRREVHRVALVLCYIAHRLAFRLGFFALSRAMRHAGNAFCDSGGCSTGED